MNRLAIVFWSGTGNTEQMAECIAQGAREAGALEDSLAGKKIALFGSFGWGDGEWMRTWSARCREKKADLYDPDGLMANEIPNAEAREACHDLGRNLASW